MQHKFTRFTYSANNPSLYICALRIGKKHLKISNCSATAGATLQMFRARNYPARGLLGRPVQRILGDFESDSGPGRTDILGRPADIKLEITQIERFGGLR